MSRESLPIGERLGRLLASRAASAPELVQRAAAAIGEALAEGHVCSELGALDAQRDAASLRRELLQSGVVGTLASGDLGAERTAPLWLDDRDRLYLRRHFCAERQLAQALRRRLQAEPLVVDAAAGAAVRATASPLPPGETDWQGIAVLAALRSRFAVITGGPGTGKTTTVARLLAVLQRSEPQLRIALAAPTGKAASRLLEAVTQRLRDLGVEPAPGLRSSTLHRLLGYLPLPDQFRRDAEHPLALDLVVVDEASMVDLELMAALLQALPDTARLVLLGDQDQLSSVAAGQVLGDLCRAAAIERGIGPYLASLATEVFGTAPAAAAGGILADAVVALRRNYRFAAQPGLDAFATATAGRDAAAAMAALQAGHDDLQWAPLPASPAALLQPISAQLLRTPQCDEPAAALASLQQLRILCATRQGPFGVAALNQAVEHLLRQHGHRTQQRYYQGQPLLITANDHQNRLYNGDLGVAWPDADGRMQAWFETGGEPRAVLPLRLPPHETAWAMTVHKAQGSEFEEVLVVLPDRDGPLLHAPLLYTAVTRARRRAHVRGDLQLIAAALQRQPWRRSGLIDALLAE